MTQIQQNKRVRDRRFYEKILLNFAFFAGIYRVKTSVLMSVAIIS
jgi:hypothetical protein